MATPCAHLSLSSHHIITHQMEENGKDEDWPKDWESQCLGHG